MATKYDKFAEECLGGTRNDLSTVNINAVLCDVNYTFSAAHEDLVDIAAGAREETSSALAGVSITGGVLDATDKVFSAVAAGDEITQIVLYNDTPAADADKRLICHLASGDVTGLPVTANGGDITIAWDDGANKILKI